MNNTPTNQAYYLLSSERLYFRALKIDDLAAWAAFFVNNPGEKFIGPIQDSSPEEKATFWLNRQICRYEKQEHGMLAGIRKSDGIMVGMAGLVHREINGLSELEIGYSVIPAYWNNGYATEMAQTIKMYANEVLKVNNLISMIMPGNTASEKVAINNGMHLDYLAHYDNMDLNLYRTN